MSQKQYTRNTSFFCIVRAHVLWDCTTICRNQDIPGSLNPQQDIRIRHSFRRRLRLSHRDNIQISIQTQQLALYCVRNMFVKQKTQTCHIGLAGK